MVASGVSGAPRSSVVLRAVLSGPGPQPVEFYVDRNRDGSFSADELVGSVQSDSTGVARLSYQVTVGVGSYRWQAVWPGNDRFSGSSADAPLEIGLTPTTLSAANVTACGVCGAISLQARLTAPTGPLAGKWVWFFVADDATAPGTFRTIGVRATDTNGVATIPYLPLRIIYGTVMYTYRAAFFADSEYGGSETAATVTLIGNG
jgi:hypothetical protein